MYLLAKWREPRAYPGIIRWFSLPEEEPFIIGGDIVTQHGARILAAVCDGDLEPIKRLILNHDADEYGRGNGVGALALLAAWGEVPRESIIDYFLWLAREGLEREQGQVWDSLAGNAADIEALEAFPELRRAYDDELMNPMFMARDELDKVELHHRGSSSRPLGSDTRPLTTWLRPRRGGRGRALTRTTSRMTTTTRMASSSKPRAGIRAPPRRLDGTSRAPAGAARSPRNAAGDDGRERTNQVACFRKSADNRDPVSSSSFNSSRSPSSSSTWVRSRMTPCRTMIPSTSSQS